jgi:protease-4
VRPLLGAVFITSLSVLAACAPPEEPSNLPTTETLYELNLLEPMPEQGTAFLGERRPGLAEATSELRTLLDEKLTKGLFVRLGPHQGHMADVDEWAELFEAFRAKHKPVHCHFETADNAAYALAAHCDRVSMTPAGSLDLVGIVAQVVFGKDLLELLGVQADLLQMGKYKGAAEPFTRDSMSPEMRSSLDGLLNDLDINFRKHLARRLKRTDAELAGLLDAGPYTAETAQAAKLVDALTFDDEARSKAKAAAGARIVRRLFTPREDRELTLRELLEALGGPEKKHVSEPHLAVVFLDGEIVDGEREGGERVGGSSFVHAMRKLGDDSDVKAVVLRIVSPGGSALASDLMWHAVRRVAKRKPVIVSVGGMAASGGYYVACAGSHIIAEPSSILGSIGVVGGKMVLRGLADKVGVNVETLPKARHAGWLSPFAPFTDEERKLFEGLLRNTYDRFLSRIAEGRKKTIAEIVPAAEGRVMGGERAREMGLVDEVGGLGRAFELALKEGKLPKDAPVTVWPAEDNPLHALSQLASGAQGRTPLESAALAPTGALRQAASLARAASGPLRPVAHWLTQGALVSVLVDQHEPVALTLPFALDLR